MIAANGFTFDEESETYSPDFIAEYSKTTPKSTICKTILTAIYNRKTVHNFFRAIHQTDSSIFDLNFYRNFYGLVTSYYETYVDTFLECCPENLLRQFCQHRDYLTISPIVLRSLLVKYSDIYTSNILWHILYESVGTSFTENAEIIFSTENKNGELSFTTTCFDQVYSMEVKLLPFAFVRVLLWGNSKDIDHIKQFVDLDTIVDREFMSMLYRMYIFSRCNEEKNFISTKTQINTENSDPKISRILNIIKYVKNFVSNSITIKKRLGSADTDFVLTDVPDEVYEFMRFSTK
jgi:hypothetical protein